MLLHLYLQQPISRTDSGFQVGGAEDKWKKEIQIRIHIVLINYQLRQIPKKSLFLNILRYNHLPTKTKDTKHYCFLIQSSMKRELDAISNLQNHLHYCFLIQSSNPIPLHHYQPSKFILHGTTNKNFSYIHFFVCPWSLLYPTTSQQSTNK